MFLSQYQLFKTVDFLFVIRLIGDLTGVAKVFCVLFVAEISIDYSFVIDAENIDFEQFFFRGG